MAISVSETGGYLRCDSENGEAIAAITVEHLRCLGVGVVVEVEHSCMSIRGVCKPGSITTTSALRGALKTDLATRAEFMALIHQS